MHAAEKVLCTHVTVSGGLNGAEGEPETDISTVATGGEGHSTVFARKRLETFFCGESFDITQGGGSGSRGCSGGRGGRRCGGRRGGSGGRHDVPVADADGAPLVGGGGAICLVVLVDVHVGLPAALTLDLVPPWDKLVFFEKNHKVFTLKKELSGFEHTILWL